MRILVNALSVTNLSGRHVLLGHLSRLARWSLDRHEFVVLHHRGNRDLRRDLGPNVVWEECPPATERLVARSAWERTVLPTLARRLRVDRLFTPAGTVVPNVPVPQVSFAQNPWSLVAGIQRGHAERLKAALQRRSYRRAMRDARCMVFNSAFMRRAYRENAGFHEQASMVIYQGVNDATFEAAAGQCEEERLPLRVLCVSVMAPHKGVDVLVRAMDVVRRRHSLAATLELVGSWPDPAYERAVRSLVHELGLDGSVEFRGHVSAEALHRSYARARVFCLMSRCESFGIPAVEAQAFGTPVVSSNCCAIPEVCGEGGVYPEPYDPAAVAGSLVELLEDDRRWQTLSAGAVANAQRFQWDVCSRPFTRVFDDE